MAKLIARRLTSAQSRLHLATNYFFLARSFARVAPATRLPASLEPYFFAALDSILLKFLPGLPMSLPARADFAE